MQSTFTQHLENLTTPGKHKAGEAGEDPRERGAGQWGKTTKRSSSDDLGCWALEQQRKLQENSSDLEKFRLGSMTGKEIRKD